MGQPATQPRHSVSLTLLPPRLAASRLGLELRVSTLPYSPFSSLSRVCQVPKADVVLASYEAFAADSAELKSFPWEVAVLDERNKSKAGLAKAHQAVTDLAARGVRGGGGGAPRALQQAVSQRGQHGKGFCVSQGHAGCRQGRGWR